MTVTVDGLNPYTGEIESYPVTAAGKWSVAKMADSMKQKLIVRGLENIEVKGLQH